jgi:ribose transport system ATP-binding protein
MEVRTQRYPQHAVRLNLRAGEIVGMAGLVGAGRSELARAVFGVDPLAGGTVRVDNVPVRLRTPKDAIDAGVYLVPEDRRGAGLTVEMTIRENITLPTLHQFATGGLVQADKEAAAAASASQRLTVKAPSVETRAANLSGGNQQKVVIARWLALDPKVLIFDEPTRGIDVGAKAEIYTQMRALAGSGIAIWMISSDMEEILNVSDRIVVLHEGKITGEIARADANEQILMQKMVGGE